MTRQARSEATSLPTRGWGPWRQDWYSLHSNPRLQDPGNGFGQWRLRWVQVIDARVHRHGKPLWLWWHNRPNSAMRRFLRRHFPNIS